jgi:hypothetical protein
MRCSSLSIGLCLTVILGCQAQVQKEEEGAVADETPAPAADSPEGKIASARSAAPKEISSAATIMDWPAMEGGEMKELRAGTNGWVCYPTTPATAGAAGDDPMCLDKEFQGWATSWMSKKTPQIKSVGVAYMLKGDKGASNTDPYATAETADNQWVKSGPHIMFITPNPALIAAIPTDPKTGGPFVMWKGTPYAHVMVPVP